MSVPPAPPWITRQKYRPHKQPGERRGCSFEGRVTLLLPSPGFDRGKIRRVNMPWWGRGQGSTTPSSRPRVGLRPHSVPIRQHREPPGQQGEVGTAAALGKD